VLKVVTEDPPGSARMMANGLSTFHSLVVGLRRRGRKNVRGKRLEKKEKRSTTVPLSNAMNAVTANLNASKIDRENARRRKEPTNVPAMMPHKTESVNAMMLTMTKREPAMTLSKIANKLAVRPTRIGIMLAMMLNWTEKLNAGGNIRNTAARNNVRDKRSATVRSALKIVNATSSTMNVRKSVRGLAVRRRDCMISNAARMRGPEKSAVGIAAAILAINFIQDSIAYC